VGNLLRSPSESERQSRPPELSEINARLKDAGCHNERGHSLNPHSERAMIEGPQLRQRRARDTQ